MIEASGHCRFFDIQMMDFFLHLILLIMCNDFKLIQIMVT